jgi:hypothetical protein
MTVAEWKHPVYLNSRELLAELEPDEIVQNKSEKELL